MILKILRQTLGSFQKSTIFVALYLLTLKLNFMEQFGMFNAFGAIFGLIIMALGLAWTVLCLILFFKVWGMCNDVRNILEILKTRNFPRDGQ
jgi:hypothetical protein